MKRQSERELHCPNCGELVRVEANIPAVACPACGEKIPGVRRERFYGEAGKCKTKMEPQINTDERKLKPQMDAD